MILTSGGRFSGDVIGLGRKTKTDLKPRSRWWAMVERISTSSSAKISATGPALSVAFEVLKNKERLLYFKSGPVVVGLIHKNAMPLQDPAVVM